MPLHIPAAVLAWVRDQAAAGVRYPTGTRLWQAASTTWATVAATGTDPATRWELTNALIDAYQSALPTVAAGDPVRSLRGGSGWYAGTVLDIHTGSGVAWIRVDQAPTGGWRPGTRVHVHRIAVEAVPSIPATAMPSAPHMKTGPADDTGAHHGPAHPNGDPPDTTATEITAPLPPTPAAPTPPAGRPNGERR